MKTRTAHAALCHSERRAHKRELNVNVNVPPNVNANVNAPPNVNINMNANVNVKWQLSASVKYRPFSLTSKTTGVLSVVVAAITMLVAVVIVLGIWV